MSNSNTIIIGYAYVVDINEQDFNQTKLDEYLEMGDKVFLDESNVIMFVTQSLNQYDPEEGIYPIDDGVLNVDDVNKGFETFQDIFYVTPSELNLKIKLYLYNDVEN